MIRRIIDANVRISRAFDSLLPARLRQDGNGHFRTHYIPRAFGEDLHLYDLGGGSVPCISLEEKTRLRMKVTGLDISGDELAASPKGVYDQAIVADLTTFQGKEEADSVVCQSTLEHVKDASGAIRAIGSCLKPGGRAFIFMPCRNAVFAQVNRILPQKMKEKLLFSLMPSKSEGHDGFQAFYDQCTPKQIKKLAEANGMEVEEVRLYWISSYFTICFPVFLLWRLYQGLLWLLIRDQACETFMVILKKKGAGSAVR